MRPRAPSPRPKTGTAGDGSTRSAAGAAVVQAVMVRGRTGVRLRGESRRGEPRVSVA
jgi:hypothetical protein